MKQSFLIIFLFSLTIIIQAQSSPSVTRGATGSITITPDSVCSGQLLQVDIAGQNTQFTQGSNTYFYLVSGTGGQIFPYQDYDSSNTSAVAYFDLIGATSGTYYFFCIDYLNDTIPSTNNLVINSTALLNIDTDKSYRGVTLDVTITGLCTNFQSATSTTVWLEKNGTDVYANSVTAVNPALLIANITLPPSLPFGLYNVYVTDPVDNLMYLAQAFQVIDDTLGAAIKAINPDDVRIFPNPASGSLFIESAEQNLSAIFLIDMNGNPVYRKDHISQNEELPIGNLPSGIYILSVTDKSGNSVHKKITIQ